MQLRSLLGAFFLMFAEVVAVVVVERPDMIWRGKSFLLIQGRKWLEQFYVDRIHRKKQTYMDIVKYNIHIYTPYR